ncbi:SRSF protein kinase 3-like isoform X1 [Lytechinus pictus]|uniref:SRSF protein kinase 3-like isoform X1 n=1 Tax=Lytechinus pictus TaxID=7653 RepID=UPI0030BA0A0D
MSSRKVMAIQARKKRKPPKHRKTDDRGGHKKPTATPGPQSQATHAHSNKPPPKVPIDSEDEEEEEQEDREGEEQGAYGSDEDEQEDPQDYCRGGYHPVKILDLFNGKYHVTRKLGWGHFSTVWLAWDLTGRRYVALKVVKSAEHYTETALDEIKLLKCVRDSDPTDIQRERVVQLIDDFKVTGVNGTHVCMVFEVLGNNLLKPIIQSKYMGLPIRQVKSIIRQVLEGLDYLHTKCKIIHTDIKPENILLCVDEDTIRRLASEAKEWMKGKAKPPVSSVSTAPAEKKPQEKMSKNKKRKMKKKQKKQLALLEKQQQQLQEIDQEKTRRLSETTEPDADRDSEDVTTDSPQNQSNNGNQSLGASGDKMVEVLEEAEEAEEDGSVSRVKSAKSPERASEKSSPEEEQKGVVVDETATNGNDDAGCRGDEAEDADVFEDASERIPSPVNEKGDGPGRKEEQEKQEGLCNGYGEENGDGDSDIDLPLKPKLPLDVKENGLDSASSTPTKESLKNAANKEKSENKGSDPNENTISENSDESKDKETLNNGAKENGNHTTVDNKPLDNTQENKDIELNSLGADSMLNGGTTPEKAQADDVQTETSGDDNRRQEIDRKWKELENFKVTNSGSEDREEGNESAATTPEDSNKDGELIEGANSPERKDELPIKLADLGNACWTYHHFTEDIQTRQYRALEVLIGAGYETAADIWSTACMAFELACGDYLFEPHSGENYSRDEDHIAHIIELVGHIPKHIALSGKYSRDFFNKKGELRNIQKLKPWSLFHVLTEKYEWPEEDAKEFASFLHPMLEFDPAKRATAKESLSHPWLYS